MELQRTMFFLTLHPANERQSDKCKYMFTKGVRKQQFVCSPDDNLSLNLSGGGGRMVAQDHNDYDDDDDDELSDKHHTKPIVGNPDTTEWMRVKNDV